MCLYCFALLLAQPDMSGRVRWHAMNRTVSLRFEVLKSIWNRSLNQPKVPRAVLQKMNLFCIQTSWT